jgi:hypothetical protein
MAYPSTFTDLQNEVIAKVRLDSTNDAQKVKDWLNQVYAEVVVENEALQDFNTMTLTAGSAVYTLDSTILRIKQMYVTPVGQSQSQPLEPVSLEQLLEWSASGGASAANTGGVTHYALMGVNLIQFYPTPQAADTITVYYVRTPTALVDGTDVPVLQEPYVTECLVNGACYKAALFLKDPDAATFKQFYDAAARNLRGHLQRKKGSMTQQFRLTRGTAVVPHDPSTDLGY